MQSFWVFIWSFGVSFVFFIFFVLFFFINKNQNRIVALFVCKKQRISAFFILEF
jgi:hypothetical protein